MTRNKFIEQYYKENYKELIKFARKRVGGYNLFLAEEAVQEAFYRAIKYYRSYDRNSEFSNWFGRILVNCINDCKKNERDKGVTFSRHTEEHDYTAAIFLTKEVIDLLDKENARNTEILNMYFFYGFKSREIAEFLSMSHDVVRDVIRTFRKKVKSD